MLLIECKSGFNPYLSPNQSNHIVEISKTVAATPILVVRKKHREVKWFKMTEQDSEEIRINEL